MIFEQNKYIENPKKIKNPKNQGIPLDLLDRMLIITTVPYSKKELRRTYIF